jgi:5-methylcytosine-specific restriction endonuclease McrA
MKRYTPIPKHKNTPEEKKLIKQWNNRLGKPVKKKRRKKQKVARVKVTDYPSYLKSKIWQKRRAKFWRQHRRECFACGAVGRIDIHHATYERIGRELDGDLVALCRWCHEEIHQLYKGKKLFDGTWQYCLDVREDIMAESI